jgi:hypothetical protein
LKFNRGRGLDQPPRSDGTPGSDHAPEFDHGQGFDIAPGFDGELGSDRGPGIDDRPGGSTAERAIVYGIRLKPNDSGLRIIFRERNDAVIVDASVQKKTADGLLLIKSDNVAVRIRDGFSPGEVERWRRAEPIHLSLQPIRTMSRLPPPAGLAYVAEHEARMRRLTSLTGTLVGLFEAGGSAIVNEPATAMPWRAFPVRPPPPLARMHNGRVHPPHSNTHLLPPRLLRPAPTPRQKQADAPARKLTAPKVVDVADGFHLTSHTRIDRI